MTNTVDGASPRVAGWEARRKRLVARRKRIKATQVDVAARAGFTQSFLSRVELGQRNADSDEVRAGLAKGLQMSRRALNRLLDGPAEEAAIRG